MIDFEAVINKFISVARNRVGSDLSTTKGPDGTIASIIRQNIAGTKGAKPDYPYLGVTLLNTADESGWITGTYLDGDDNVVYFTNKTVSIQYTVHGKNSVSIANKLHKAFTFDSVRDSFRTDLNGSIVSVGKIIPVTRTDVDKYIDSAFFVVTMNIQESDADTSSGVIESINADGELYRDISDIDPLALNISAP
jgi:hypothetical protein